MENSSQRFDPDLVESDRDAHGLEIVEYDKETRAPVRLDGDYLRDEDGQAAYLRELLEVFDAEHVGEYYRDH